MVNATQIFFSGVIMLPLVSYDYFSKFGYDQYGLQYGLALVFTKLIMFIFVNLIYDINSIDNTIFFKFLFCFYFDYFI